MDNSHYNTIRLIILDFDGIISGSKTYDKSGLCISKTIKDQSWTAIKRFRAANIPVHILTGDVWNKEILEARNVPANFTRGIEKTLFLPELCLTYNVSPNEIAYLGDDLFDVGLLKVVGFPFCPADSVQECVTIGRAQKLTSKGGEEIIMELFYWCRHNNLIPKLDFEEEYAKILKLDEREKF